MFGEITLLVILQGAALLAAGTAAGYFLALQRFDKQQNKLQDELDSARTELKQHREQVDTHFLKTGLLFNRLTDNYREIYEHLATGAQNLCSTQVTKQQLDQPETRVLPAAVDDNAGENEQVTAQTLHPEAESPETENAEARHAESASAETEVSDHLAADATASDNSSAPGKEEPPADMPGSAKKPAADEISAIDERTADDEHIGADAAPAPAQLQEENATQDTPAGTETPATMDQHKSPPSIH